MEFRAICAHSFLPYRDKDYGSGRCRISTDDFERINSNIGSTVPAKIGQVVRIQLALKPKAVEVLCTLWPDTDGYLGSGEIVVDDSISQDRLITFEWTESISKVSGTFYCRRIWSDTLGQVPSYGLSIAAIALPLGHSGNDLTYCPIATIILI